MWQRHEKRVGGGLSAFAFLEAGMHCMALHHLMSTSLFDQQQGYSVCVPLAGRALRHRQHPGASASSSHDYTCEVYTLYLGLLR